MPGLDPGIGAVTSQPVETPLEGIAGSSPAMTSPRLDRKGVGDVAGQGPRRGQHNVEGDVVAGKVRMSCEPILRGPDDAPPRARRQRPAGLIESLALLHLDEGEPLAFERHEIDLAHRGLVAPGDDAVSFEAKQKRGMVSANSP